MSDLSTCPDCGKPWGANVNAGCEGCEEFIFGVNRYDVGLDATLEAIDAALIEEAERGYDPDKMIPRRITLTGAPGLVGFYASNPHDDDRTSDEQGLAS